ncbi:MAG: hypothetical protein PHR35_23300 [Kiritimatiellae bacterium]|nr:hypothetical protein [Kiritimatiellia bacterium]
MTGRDNRFWDRGFSVFTDELAKEERYRLDPLKAQLKTTGDSARKAHIKEQMAGIKAEFRRRRKDAAHSLFGKA